MVEAPEGAEGGQCRTWALPRRLGTVRPGPPAVTPAQRGATKDASEDAAAEEAERGRVHRVSHGSTLAKQARNPQGNLADAASRRRDQFMAVDPLDDETRAALASTNGS